MHAGEFSASYIMSWSGGGQLYGRERFDPVQVCARIAAMQAVFYGAFAVSAFVLASLMSLAFMGFAHLFGL